MRKGTIVFLLLSLPLLGTGCSKHKDRTAALQGVALKPIRLTCQHTSAPEFEISLPDGFQSEWVMEAMYDKFYFFNAADTSRTQKGMVILDITPAPLPMIADSSNVQKYTGTIAGNEVQWRERKMFDVDNSLYIFQHETIDTKTLKNFVNAKAGAPLTIHVIVTGKDSMLVERLNACVETLKVLQAKPNL